MILKDFIATIEPKTMADISDNKGLSFWNGEIDNAPYNIQEKYLNARVIEAVPDKLQSWQYSGLRIVVERPRDDVEHTTRWLELQRIANCVEAMSNKYIKEPISITYEELTDESVKAYSDWNRQRFGLCSGEEAFFIFRRSSLLYVVNVSADSYLTAARELMDLIGRKF